VKPAIRKLTIKSLHGQMEILKFVRDDCAMQFEDGKLDQGQKSVIAQRWDAALKESRSLLLTLDRLEQEEREKTNPFQC
jgi:hypothetical protein